MTDGMTLEQIPRSYGDLVVERSVPVGALTPVTPIQVSVDCSPEGNGIPLKHYQSEFVGTACLEQDTYDIDIDI